MALKIEDQAEESIFTKTQRKIKILGREEALHNKINMFKDIINDTKNSQMLSPSDDEMANTMKTTKTVTPSDPNMSQYSLKQPSP